MFQFFNKHPDQYEQQKQRDRDNCKNEVEYYETVSSAQCRAASSTQDKSEKDKCMNTTNLLSQSILKCKGLEEAIKKAELDRDPTLEHYGSNGGTFTPTVHFRRYNWS